MAKLKLTSRGDTYEFETHRIGHGGVGYFAVNVKVYGLYAVRPSDRFLPQWIALSPEERRDIENRAYERTQEEWWGEAVYLANTMLGERCFSEGSQGGWLVLPGYSAHKLEDLAEDGDSTPCKNCNFRYADHVNEACLFDSTRYTPEPNTAGSDGRRQLLDLVSFADQIKASLLSVPELLQSNLNDLIFNLLPTAEDTPDVRPPAPL